jgi:hypothetical protein
MRLVEICVDGGLEATMYSAQSQLADAYIAAGAATEALFIAEDLVAREPWDNSNIERFRRALELSGEPDPDALIASRLSGESPFTSTDLLLAGDRSCSSRPSRRRQMRSRAWRLTWSPSSKSPSSKSRKSRSHRRPSRNATRSRPTSSS